MSRIVSFTALCAAFALSASAEVLSTEPSCAYPVAHASDADVAAVDPNDPVALPPLELELRRYIPVRAAWFLEASLAALRLDLQTGAFTGQGGLAVSQAAAAGCD